MQKAYFCIVLIDGGPIPDVVGNTSLVPVKGRSTPKTQRVSYQNWQWISGRIFCQYSIPIRSDLNFINEIGPFMSNLRMWNLQICIDTMRIESSSLHLVIIAIVSLSSFQQSVILCAYCCDGKVL